MQFRQTSVPAGIVNQTTSPASGTIVTTVTAPDTSGTYKFAYWTLNGVWFTDLSGYASNPASFVINAATDAVASYVPTTQDCDRDGLPDW